MELEPPTSKQIDVQRIDINWLGINKNFIVETSAPDPDFENFYTGCNPEGALKVRRFKEVLYKNLYSNIHLRYYVNRQNLKYDYIVEPGGDYRQITIQVSGVDDIIIQQDGSVVLQTEFGSIIEEAPLVYQDGRQLRAKWIIIDNTLKFEIMNCRTDRQMVIDPVVRSWGTYYGGSFTERTFNSSKDIFGNVYLTGWTFSPNNIATSGSHQSSLTAGTNAFLVKFNSDGVRRWATYYGAGYASAAASATDREGNIYMAGNVASPPSSGTVIATPLSYQPAFAGGPSDGFLVKFDSMGVRQWATYFGGTNADGFGDCSIDSSGNVCLVGSTNSSGMATNFSQQSNLAGGYDLLLVKFSPAGLPIWSTYCGGSQDDTGTGCTIDSNENIYVSGFTNSTNNIATFLGFQTTNSGNYDSFLIKYNSLGILQWGTYFGGPEEDSPGKCAVDMFGDVYLSGSTISTTMISTPNGHQTTLGGNWDGYLVKFKTSGERVWATYYGGTERDFGYGCSVDPSGNVYLVGDTRSKNGQSIATSGSPQSTHGGGGFDAFLVKFNPSGQRLWATYYGGSDVGYAGYTEDRGTSCVANTSESVFMSGLTSASGLDTIASFQAHQTSFGGHSDAFLVKFSECNLFPDVVVGSSANPMCQGDSVNLMAIGAVSYIWNNRLTDPSITLSPTTTTTYTVVGYDLTGCYDIAYITQNVDVCTNMFTVTDYQKGINIFPNPTKGHITIDIGEFDSGKTIAVYNSTGQLVPVEFNMGAVIDLTGYADGIYFLRVIENGTVISHSKVIKVNE